MMASRFNVAVIGGGPAGLAAAIAASEDGASVILIEREARLGGILKQCVHDGFGLVRYEEKLAGPEYAFRDITALYQTNTLVMLQTFVTHVERMGGSFLLTLSNRHGLVQVEAGSLVLATGCRERTSKQIAIHGMRPAGVLTAGAAQYYTNILGQLPAKKCVILGSGDIGMIMARRLTLEGATVLGVYEAKSTPGGLLRNISQCLNDFDIPLHLSHTVTRVFGSHRLKAVETCRVDKDMNPIRGSEKLVKCDTLILSVGLIPENELAESLGVEICKSTQGPVCDQNYMTMADGIFSCGNALHVNDLVDYVSESGMIAGLGAARYMQHNRTLIKVNASKDFLYSVPQCFDFETMRSEAVIYFRTSEVRKKALVRVIADEHEVFAGEFDHLRPPEMERISVDFGTGLAPDSKINLVMEAKV
jgi:thioredoxin reductase